MTNISAWSTAAGSNNSAPPDGAPENMLPGKVNDCIREVMAAAARWYGDLNGSLVSTGTSTAYTLTTNSGHATLASIPLLTFRAHLANTGAATLAVDGLAARSLVKNGGTALSSGDLLINQITCVSYNPNLDRFDIIGQTAATAATDSVSGVVELATVTETKARTSATTVVTPAGLTDFARIKTGSYTGDGTTSQAITGVGFQPKYVKITERITGDDAVEIIWTTDVIVDDMAAGAAVTVNIEGTAVLGNRILSLNADGFTVSDDNDGENPNDSGVVYNYLAIG